MAETKKDTSSKRWYLQGENRVRYAGIAADGTIPEIDREALHRLISVKLAATGFEVPETSTQDEGVMKLASDLFRQYAEQVSSACMGRDVLLQHILCCILFFGPILVCSTTSFRFRKLRDCIWGIDLFPILCEQIRNISSGTDLDLHCHRKRTQSRILKCGIATMATIAFQL